jgi:hypothetical protein
MLKVESPSSLMRPVLSAASDLMQRYVVEFLKACLHESEHSLGDVMDMSMRKGSSVHETGLFSLGILATSDKLEEDPTSKTTRHNAMEMSVTKFVTAVLFPKTKLKPEVRNALTFRRIIARWSMELDRLKKELATTTNEDTSAPSYNFSNSQKAIDFLDSTIQKELLPVLQEEAVNGTISGLERQDAFDPILDRSVYNRSQSLDPKDVDMCYACQCLYQFTGPLFMALHRLPPGGDMYLPLVAVLEHVLLTFISRVKQQVEKLCSRKAAFSVLNSEVDSVLMTNVMERRKPFSMLMQAYTNADSFERSSQEDDSGKGKGISPLAPSTGDTLARQSLADMKEATLEETAEGVDGEEQILDLEAKHLTSYLDFVAEFEKSGVVVASDEELMKAASLAHSLLKLAGLLDARLNVRTTQGSTRSLISVRTLREAIKTIKQSGIKMAKFCRLDMLMQVITRLSRVCRSSTIVSHDAVRIPMSVNELGEYLIGASDNLRDAVGNIVTAYTFSSLEQYIPLCLMQTVRAIAAGKGIISKAPLTMNGIEALDRSGSILYRDLKGATSFAHSFWDVELAAVSFERSASFMAMLELEMEELVAYYLANKGDFSPQDFQLIFSMNGPRRRGDVGRFHLLNRQA